MKTKLLSFAKQGFVIGAFLFINSIVQGATYTAVASGNWSSSATWGGTAPSFSIISDQVSIPVGISVTMDENLALDGLTASVDVEGTLSSASNMLTVTIGTISGAGTVTVNNVVFDVGATLSFSGSLTTNILKNMTVGLQSSATMMVNQTLTLAAGSIVVLTSGTLTVGSNATIIVSGGLLSLSGGKLLFTSAYNVTYTSGSTSAGLELSGSGLENLTINVNSGDSVTLSSNLTIAGILTLSNGIFSLGGYNLMLEGDVSASGTGSISATSASNFSINSNTGISGAIPFNGNSSLKNFRINIGSNNHIQIEGNLTVMDTLELSNSIFDFFGASLTLNGKVQGWGIFSGNAASNLIVNTKSGVTDTLNFARSGQYLNNLSITTGVNDSVVFKSSLMVNGSLSLSAGNAIINNDTLTVNGNIDGSGFLTTNSKSVLILNSSTGITAPLSFKGLGLGGLMVNIGSGNTVTLGSDLTVLGSFSLQNGMLGLNGHSLSLMGTIASGSGTISSTVSSVISINMSSSPLGSISFSSNADTVNTISVNIMGGGSVMIGSDLVVQGSLNLMGGFVDIGSNTLQIDGSVSGSSSSSYVITGLNGYLGMNLMAGSTASVFPIGTFSNYFPATIMLNPSSSNGTVSVNVSPNVYADGTTGAAISSNQPLVDATWFVKSTIASNLSLNLQVEWSSSAEVNGFNRSAAYISHYEAGAWDTSAIMASTARGGGMYSLERSDITSLSPFAVFNQNTNTGIMEVKNAPRFEVYPNPVSADLFIKDNSGFKDIYYIDVINVIGQVVNTFKLADGNLVISLNDLDEGNYFIKIYNDKINETKKITKM